MTAPTPAPTRPAFASRLVYPVAGLMLALHLVTNLVSPYGIHRDEFLYFAMGQHLRLWRMDFPPFIAIVSNVQRFIFGDSLVGLPPVVSAAGSFYFFGPGDKPGRVAVTLGEGEEGLHRFFDSVEAGPHLTNPLTVREERDLTVYICRGNKMTLQEIWPGEAGRQ